MTATQLDLRDNTTCFLYMKRDTVKFYSMDADAFAVNSPLGKYKVLDDNFKMIRSVIQAFHESKDFGIFYEPLQVKLVIFLLWGVSKYMQFFLLLNISIQGGIII